MWSRVGVVVCLLSLSIGARAAPIRLAVMDFTAASPAGELDALGVGLQSMITTDLSEVGALVLVERARLHDLQAELKLQSSAAIDKQTAARLGQLAGASHLLVGSFTAVGGKLRIDARLFVVASGEVVLAEKAEGEQAAFFTLEKQIVRRLVEAVGVRLNKTEKAELAKPKTTNFTAFDKYSQGLVLLDDKKPAEAVTALEAAVAADAGFALAVNKLAEARKLLAALPAPKAPECKANPLQSPPCQTEGAAPPSVPTVVAGPPTAPVGVTVRAGGAEVRCLTPCQLYLPPGKVDVEVDSPPMRRQFDVGGGAASLVVTTRNRMQMITGIVLTSLGVALSAAAIGIAESNASTNPAQQYWPLFMGLGIGAIVPGISYLLAMGRNDVRVVNLNRAHASRREARPRLVGVGVAPTAGGVFSSLSLRF